MIALRTLTTDAGLGLAWRNGPDDVLTAPSPIVLETGAGTVDEGPDGLRLALRYDSVSDSAEGLVGTATGSAGGARYHIEDRWSAAGTGTWRLDRRVEVLTTGIGGFRVGLELSPGLQRSSYHDFHYFAPPAPI